MRGIKSMAENIYDRVTNAIIASLEKGVGSWSRPWTVKAGATSPLPYNIASGANYRGINTVMLWCAREEHGYETQCWGTFDQWKAKGATVRKGEKATHIVFFKPTESRVQDPDGGDETVRKGMIARGYCVFNLAQVDGYEAPKVAETPEVERIAHADDFFRATGARIRHGGTRAFYVPSAEFISMPDRDAFGETARYYSVLAHETGHWTGHTNRLDRSLNTGRFGDEAYAAEELIAELTAAFICAHLGLDNEPRDDHASYIASWLKVLKRDNRAIFTAASAAQKATDYLISMQAQVEMKLAA
jgi:antirestriction protein ArdC